MPADPRLPRSRRRWVPAAAVAAFLLAPLRPFGAQDPVPADGTRSAAAAEDGSEGTRPPGKDESLFSVDYGKLLLEDGKAVVTAPAHWDAKDWIVFSAGTALIVGTAAGLDQPARNFVQRNRSRATDEFRRVAEPFGSYAAFGVLGAFYGAGAILHDSNAKATALDGLSASLYSVGLTTILKESIGRARPNAHEGSHRFRPFSGDSSFPSGHATEAFTVASVIAEHSDRFWVKALSYTAATAVGYARMEVNRHFLSDVMGGALIGTAVGNLVAHHNEEGRRTRVSFEPLDDGESAGLTMTCRF